MENGRCIITRTTLRGGGSLTRAVSMEHIVHNSKYVIIMLCSFIDVFTCSSMYLVATTVHRTNALRNSSCAFRVEIILIRRQIINDKWSNIMRLIYHYYEWDTRNFSRVSFIQSGRTGAVKQKAPSCWYFMREDVLKLFSNFSISFDISLGHSREVHNAHVVFMFIYIREYKRSLCFWNSFTSLSS